MIINWLFISHPDLHGPGDDGSEPHVGQPEEAEQEIVLSLYSDIVLPEHQRAHQRVQDLQEDFYNKLHF